MRLHTLAGLVLNPCGNADRCVRHNAALVGVMLEALLICAIFARALDGHRDSLPFSGPRYSGAGERPAEDSRISPGSEP
jgi:hypothetical protein